jgi:predicted MPP superfamily phosphohydrolase
VVGKEDIPLTLSGHTHAAQFSLFGGWTPSKLLYPHNRGLYREQDQYLYVNIGLGETIFPARLGAVPEITLITLRRD